MPGEGAGALARRGLQGEQRSQPAAARLNRVRSALTQPVKVVVRKKANIHAVYPAAESGQLPFLGSTSAPSVPPAGWQPVRGPLRAAAAGGLWLAWPCGLLQSALRVASLAGSVAAGAGPMAGFALASSAGLVAAPWVWRRLHPRGGPTLAHAGTERALVRGAGALRMLGSAFALGHGAWHPVVVFCGWA